jgi:hypothetical protein
MWYQSKTKIRKTDTLFSNYLRELRKWKCERCQKNCIDNHHNLTVSHFQGRRKENVRFDEENCDVFCRKCHDWAEKHKKTEYREWKLNQLGKRRFDLLTLRANNYKKRDDKLDEIIIKEKIKNDTREVKNWR